MFTHSSRSLPAAPRSVRRTRMVSRAAALCLALSLLPAAPSGAADGNEARLAETQRRIERTLAQLDDVAGRAEQTAAQVAEAQAAVDQLETELNALLAEVQAQQQRVAAAQTEAQTARAEADRIVALVHERARQAFMGGRPTAFSVMTEQEDGDLGGAIDQLAMLNSLAARDAASIEGLDSARAQAQASAERLAVALEDLDVARATQQDLLAQAEVVFASRADALAVVTGERERLLANQEQLEDEADDIQALIAAEEAAAKARAAAEARAARVSARTKASSQSAPQPSSNPAPPSSSGCYQKPAQGAYTSEYGPRWGRMHAGVDIDGNTGDPIVAAQTGTVTFSGFQGGYGRLTLIKHSDGVTTAYAHQSSASVSQGQTVSRGEFIGRIGTTGNVTGSHLHFETRTSSGTRDPRNYLC